MATQQEIEAAEVVNHAKEHENGPPGKYIWRTSWIVILGVLVWIYQDTFLYKGYAEKYGTPYYPNSWLLVSVGVAITIFSLRRLATYLFTDYMETLLSHEKFPGEKGHIEAKRMVKWCCDMVFYTISSVACWIILSQGNYLPKCIGGSGDCYDMVENYPNLPAYPGLVGFYLFEIGHHMYSVFEHLVFKRNDYSFDEMFLHHLLSLGLMVTSYQMNFLAIGAIILLTRDPCDIFLSALRFYADFKKPKDLIVMAIYIPCLLIWLWLRGIVSPLCPLYAAIKCWNTREPEVFMFMWKMMGFQIIMLVGLCGMDFFWIIRLFRKGWTQISAMFTVKKVKRT